MKTSRKNGTAVLPAPPPDTSRPHASPEVSVRIVSTEGQLAALEEKWNTLVAASPVTVYQTFEWNSLWWRHFGGQSWQRLNILAFELDGELIGIIPLLAETVRIAGVSAGWRLRFLGSGSVEGGGPVAEYGPSDYLDAIVPERFEVQVLQAFVKYITALPREYSQIYLSDIPEESVLIRHLSQRLQDHSIVASVSPSDICPRIRLPESSDLYVQSRKPEVRRRLRQVRVSLEKQFSVGGSLSPHEMDEAIEELIRLHQDRWTSSGYPGVYSDPRFCRFQAAIASAYAKKKWLWLRSLKYNDGIVAVRLGFRFRGRFYDYMSGYDSTREVSRFRPGLALLYVMMDEAIQEQAEWLDLLRGNEPYKFDFSTESRQNWEIDIRLHGDRFPSYMFFVVALQWNRIVARIRRERRVLLVHTRRHGSSISSLGHYFGFVARRVAERMNSPGPESQPRQGRKAGE